MCVVFWYLAGLGRHSFSESHWTQFGSGWLFVSCWRATLNHGFMGILGGQTLRWPPRMSSFQCPYPCIVPAAGQGNRMYKIMCLWQDDAIMTEHLSYRVCGSQHPCRGAPSIKEPWAASRSCGWALPSKKLNPRSYTCKELIVAQPHELGSRSSTTWAFGWDHSLRQNSCETPKQGIQLRHARMPEPQKLKEQWASWWYCYAANHNWNAFPKESTGGYRKQIVWKVRG